MPLSMRDVRLMIPDPVKQFLRETIVASGGNEVFFLGRVAWSGEAPQPVATLTEVDVLARGNSSSVLALTHRARGWDLAIHNHPSGRLEPSEADSAVAFQLSLGGLGFAIIGNDAERHYLVIPPFQHAGSDTEPIDPEEVRRVFHSDGPLAKELGSGYEARQGQIDMALEVTRALNQQGVVALEAGTGIGKSFAYLVPAILWAVRNKQKIVVSTGTINLQEQITQKDLPLLAKALPVKFQFALVKGRNNFACKRKLEELDHDLRVGNLVLDDTARQLTSLVEWASASPVGSKSELSWFPPFAVWEQVMSESDKSLKAQCKHYHECFYYASKRAADKADVLVVNHHLLFSDLRVRRETENYTDNLVIPAYRRVIFDEAQHLEDVASEYFGLRFSTLGIRMRLSRLIWQNDATRGVIPALAKRLTMYNDRAAAEKLLNVYQIGLQDARQRIDDHFDALEELVMNSQSTFNTGSGRREAEAAPIAAEVGKESVNVVNAEVTLRYKAGSLQEHFWYQIAEGLKAIEDQLATLLVVNDLALSIVERSSLTDEQKQGQSIELQSFEARLKAFITEMARFRDFEETSQVRWLTLRPARSRSQDRFILEFAASPIRVDEPLQELVYKIMDTVVMTSATLSVGGKGDFIAERLGLRSLEGRRYRFSEYPSPFDYRNQVVTAVPTDFPLPESREFAPRLADAVHDVLEASGGRAFVLFTSYSLLRRTYDAVAPRLRALGLRPVSQGDAQRSEILDRFRAGAANVLFGTDSFWEGVDVKGRALECVILTRLPFRVPTEPVQEARIEEIEARGENSFSAFTVPQAVLKFKQGFGRLIRSQTDRGVVVVLDRRILTKAYGRVFLASLPETKLLKDPLVDVVEYVREFFDRSIEIPENLLAPWNEQGKVEQDNTQQGPPW